MSVTPESCCGEPLHEYVAGATDGFHVVKLFRCTVCGALHRTGWRPPAWGNKVAEVTHALDAELERAAAGAESAGETRGEPIDRPLGILLAACTRAEATQSRGVGWPQEPRVLARLHESPEQFEDAVVVPALEAAWTRVVESNEGRVLLSALSMGAGPGMGWGVILRAHDLPTGARVYSEERDFPEAGVFLVAMAYQPGDSADKHVVEQCLVDGDDDVTSALLNGSVEELRTILDRNQLVELLVEHFDRLAELEESTLAYLVEDVPEYLEPYSIDWKRWLVERSLPEGRRT